MRNNKKYTFKKKHYMSGDGMLTTIWGPNLWHYLHTISFNYPVNPSNDDKKYYKQFIMNLQYTLPCKYCRINFKNNLKYLPLTNDDMKNHENFSKYVYKLHELINKMLKKNSGLTYCDVRERYENFRSRCTLNDQKNKIFNFKKKIKENTKEKGCTEPLYGKKARCILNIVPHDNRKKTIKIDNKCIKTRRRK